MISMSYEKVVYLVSGMAKLIEGSMYLFAKYGQILSRIGNKLHK
jgi:hypothetical protein